MNYINMTTGEYPVSAEMIRAENPNSIFGSPFIPPSNFKLVKATPKPEINQLTHFVEEIAPAWGANSEFVQQWEIKEYDKLSKDTLLSAKHASIWQAIKNMRDLHFQTGGYKVGDKWFHSDLFSRNQQLSLIIMGANIPKNLQWKTMDGSYVTMTKKLATDIFAAAATSDQNLFAYAESLRLKVCAAADPMSVDISSGWPELYMEKNI